MGDRIKVALFGANGHQVHGRFPHPQADVVAVGAFPDERIPPTLANVPRYRDLDELLGEADADLVVLCSPRRDEQAGHAIRCMEAGLHVYGEKPSATTEAELDAVMCTSRQTGRMYREMAPTMYQRPYQTIRPRSLVLIGMEAHVCVQQTGAALLCRDGIQSDPKTGEAFTHRSNSGLLPL